MERPGRELEYLQRPPDPDPYGAFRCRFAGCNARYRRKEHLKRHERSKHTKQQTLVCSSCDREFRRSDTLRRHIENQHKLTEPLNRARQACVNCHTHKTRCEGGIPCEKCVRRNIQCFLQDHARTIEKPRIQSSTAASASLDYQHSSLSLGGKEKQWIDRFFDSFHPHWPFIHRGSFEMRQEAPLLLQSMIALGMWTTRERSTQSLAVELHDKLDSAIRNQREKWEASEVEETSSARSWPIATYQAILLHIILSVFIETDGVVNFDFNASVSDDGLALLRSLVGSCQSLGMFFYPNILARYIEVDLPSFVWVGVEEVKRFNIALYKLCAKLMSASAENKPLLRASELHFPPPSNDPLWNSLGKKEWEANAKEDYPVNLKDDFRARWISRYADILKSFV